MFYLGHRRRIIGDPLFIQTLASRKGELTKDSNLRSALLPSISARDARRSPFIRPHRSDQDTNLPFARSPMVSLIKPTRPLPSLRVLASATRTGIGCSKCLISPVQFLLEIAAYISDARKVLRAKSNCRLACSSTWSRRKPWNFGGTFKTALPAAPIVQTAHRATVGSCRRAAIRHAARFGLVRTLFPGQRDKRGQLRSASGIP